MTHFTHVSVFFLLYSLYNVYAKTYTTTIQRMEKVDKDYFIKKYYRKRPLVMPSATTHFTNVTKNIFSFCQQKRFSLAKLPSMTGEEISLREALLPCGQDCYGIHREKLCKDFLYKISHPLYSHNTGELYLSIAKGDIETPPAFEEEDICIYQSSGVTEWRLLTNYRGSIDLFSQHFYNTNLATGDLLYIPKDTISQHLSITKLSMMLAFPCSPQQQLNSIEVKIK